MFTQEYWHGEPRHLATQRQRVRTGDDVGEFPTTRRILPWQRLDPFNHAGRTHVTLPLERLASELFPPPIRPSPVTFRRATSRQD